MRISSMSKRPYLCELEARYGNSEPIFKEYDVECTSSTSCRIQDSELFNSSIITCNMPLNFVKYSDTLEYRCECTMKMNTSTSTAPSFFTQPWFIGMVVVVAIVIIVSAVASIYCFCKTKRFLSEHKDDIVKKFLK